MFYQFNPNKYFFVNVYLLSMNFYSKNGKNTPELIAIIATITKGNEKDNTCIPISKYGVQVLIGLPIRLN